MASFSWDGHDGTGWNFNIGATNLIKFAGSTYSDKVVVNSYPDSTHIRTSLATDSDTCSSPHLDNIKYVDASNCSINGAASEVVTNIQQTECIRIQFTHTSSVATENAILWAYDGSIKTNGPTDITFQALEQGDSSWTNAEGSSSALSLANQAGSTSHDYYVAMSAAPTATGEQTNFAITIELDYY